MNSAGTSRQNQRGISGDEFAGIGLASATFVERTLYLHHHQYGRGSSDTLICL